LKGSGKVTLNEKKDLISALAQNYLFEKENDQVWQREHSFAYAMSLGKLLGACSALGYELEETKDYLTIISKKRIVIQITTQ